MRLLVLLLLLANMAFTLWTRGWLRDLGLGPTAQTESHRLAQQIHPEALRLLTPEQVQRLDALAAQLPSQTLCLEAGLFDDNQSQSLRQELRGLLPEGAWTLRAMAEPARWIVYLGKYADTESLAKKKQELEGKGVAFEAPRNPSWEPGIVLGGFASQAQAQQMLKTLETEGVHTAKVVLESPEQRGSLLRLPVLDASVTAHLEQVRSLLNGKELRLCKQ